MRSASQSAYNPLPALSSSLYYKTISTVDQSDSELCTGAVAEVHRKSLYNKILYSKNDSHESEQAIFVKRGRVILPPIKQQQLTKKGTHKHLFKPSNESKPLKVRAMR